jgi:beta-N-acetylhexosaminidase
MRIFAALSLLVALAPPAAGAEPLDARIEAMIDAMTPRARAAQLLLVGFSGTRVNDEIRRLVGEWQVGGIAIYSRNVNSPAQLRTLTSDIRSLAPGPPPLIAVDQEGGEVSRIADEVPRLPGQMALGATRSPELARRSGRELGTRLRELGVTLNLAPVLDLAEPRSPIGIRAFAADPKLTGLLGVEFIRGQREGGIASTAKHFPGIGATPTDSHDALPSLDASLEELRRLHFSPFRAAIEAGVEAIMIGHVAVPAVDGATPATLSPKLIGMLRTELHFDGVVITDALEMKALDGQQGVGRLAVRSIAAGADLVMVLWHERDREQVLATLEAALRSGELPAARVRTSLRRILRLKLRETAAAIPSTGAPVADRIAEGSVTLLRDDAYLLPLRPDSAQLYIGPEGPIADAVRAANALTLPPILPEESLDDWSARARTAAENVSVIVGAAQNLGQLAVIRAAREARPAARLVLVSLGSPQLITQISGVDVYLCTYGYLAPSQRAAAALLSGKAGAYGRLPVDVPPSFHAGDGIILERRRPH